MPTYPAYKLKPYYDTLKTWLLASHNEDGTLRSDAVQAEVSAAIADNQTVVDAAAAAVDANPVIAYTNPGEAGASGEYLTIGPSGPAWLDEPVFNVKHPRFGAVGDEDTDDTAAIQAAIDAAEAYTVKSVTKGAIVYFPPGIYTINGGITVSKPGITLRGAGRQSVWLRGMSGDVLTLANSPSGIRLESMRIVSNSGAGHCIAITKGLSKGLFMDLWVSQHNNDKSVLWGDEVVNGQQFNYIDNLWLHCETSHEETATIASFHLKGGAVNRNRWLSMRHTYSGNYVWNIEASTSGAYAFDNTIDGVNMEVCTGGVARLVGARGTRLVDVAAYDLLNTSTKDLFLLTSNGTNRCGVTTFENVRRVGFTLGSGLYDVKLDHSAHGETMFLNSGIATTPLTVDAGYGRVLQIGGNLTLTNGDASSWIRASFDGSRFGDPVIFGDRSVLWPRTTAQRNALTGVAAGTTVYDTTLGKPVYYNGTAWTDASGTVV